MLLMTVVTGLTLTAADAATVFRNVVGQGDVVEFTDEQGPCSGDGKLTHWNIKAGPRAGETVRGCYWIRPDGQVLMRYEDGDQYVVPLKMIMDLDAKQGT